jgi:undecaprenyl-diphosphatase
MHTLDLSLLHFFNQTLASPLLDAVSNVLVTVRYWLPVYVIAGLYLIYKYKWQGVWLVLAAVLLITATDSLAHYILKPLVASVRPCAAVSWIRLPDGPRFDPSFPSNHALNNFAIATFFSLVFRRPTLTITLFTFATLISLGRVYQGLHYPSDVMGGALIGVAMGYVAVFIFRTIERRSAMQLTADRRAEAE